jgi:hypothetical protein
MTEIQSQDIEKRRPATHGAPPPNEGRTRPQDRPPGQPHDPPPQTGQDNEVEREPNHDSRQESDQGPKRRREPGRSG